MLEECDVDDDCMAHPYCGWDRRNHLGCRNEVHWSLDTLLAEYLRRDSVLVDLYLLSIPIRQLPAGTTYSVWVGIGSIGVTLFGIIMFGENASPMRLACLGLILVGVIGLKLLPT
jgi:multidrug transporter EmrE-like cation transporter